MAKYVLQVNTNFGPFGATNKAPQDGEIADRNSLKDIATQQVQVAGARWEIIKLYLIANYQIFQNGEINFADNVSVISQRTLKFSIMQVFNTIDSSSFHNGLKYIRTL
jgi:hypothetical protein